MEKVNLLVQVVDLDAIKFGGGSNGGLIVTGFLMVLVQPLLALMVKNTVSTPELGKLKLGLTCVLVPFAGEPNTQE